MIPPNTQVAAQVTTATRSQALRLDEGSLAHIIGVLTHLYSDPIEAIVREYSTNAYDSHVEAGRAHLPIEVTTPTQFNPNFTVVDRGVGLSVDDLLDVYSAYGASTKRSSNAVTGMLGLGCKSALAHVPAFTVTAVKAGVQVVATIGKGADGVGVVNILDTSATDEADGVTVTVPIRQADHYDVREAAEKVFSFWPKGTVLLNGTPPNSLEDLHGDGLVWLDEDRSVAILHHAAGTNYIVQGNVAYPFRFSHTNRIPGFNHGIVAFVNIGDIDFAPSREALQETALTVDTIGRLRDYVEETWPRVLNELVEAETTAWGKLKVAFKWASSGFYKSLNLGRYSGGVEDRPIFHYRGRGHKVSSRFHLGLSDLLATEGERIVTGFTSKTVSPSARERLELFGISRCWLLPEGYDLTPFEGREDLVAWSEIVAQTTLPRAARPPAKPKDVYTFFHNGQEVTGTLDETKPILYLERYKDDFFRPKIDPFPEAQIVRVYPHQYAKLARIYPTTESHSSYTSRVRAEAVAALLPEDSLIVTPCPAKLSALFPYLDSILDPDFTEAAKWANTPETARIKRARAVGATVPESEFFDNIVARYSLLNALDNYSYRYLDTETKLDLVTYINAKFAQTAQATLTESETATS